MKTMRKKCLKQSLSILLLVIFVCSMIPKAIAAQLTAEKSEASKIVREITELREESVKHFLCEDGSYIAATYATPVHYQENGVWKEIDNSLSLTSRTIDASAKSAYAPKAGSVDVNLPQSFAGGEKITARNGEHTLSFGVAADAKNVSIGKQAAVTKVDALPSVAMEEKELTATTNLPDDVVSSKAVYESASVQDYNDEKMAVANQSGAVVYKGIFDDADLEYIVSSNCVKENIVVYAPQKTYTYTFNMDFGDLIPAQQKNGSIWLLESADADEPVFVLETPYMYDADNMDSYAVTMSLKPNGDGYAMTVKADAEWINSAERTFPVVIDPTFTFASSAFDDMYVINGLGAGSQWRNNELRVGRNLTNLARSYIQMSMPSSIPMGSEITNAVLTLKQASYFQSLNQSNVSIRIYDCAQAQGYPYSTITWNNQPFSNTNNGYQNNGATLLDYKTATKNETSYTFNVTAALQRWFSETGNNHYLMLASSNENSKTQIDLRSSRVNNSSNRPQMQFTYVTPGDYSTNYYLYSANEECFHFSSSYSGSWNVTAQSNWLTVSPHSGNGSVNFMVFASEHIGFAPREGTVTVQTGAETVTINVTQLDAVSGYFNQINSSRTSCTACSSNEYNHPLATWAMQLSYAAYNPAEADEAWDHINIPSGMMQAPYNDDSYDAKYLLDNCGFSDVEKYNYGDQATAAAHVVGYRDIMLGDYTNIQNRTNNIGGIVNEHNREDSGLLRGTTTDNRSFIGTFSNSVQISNVEREPDGVFEESISRYLQKDFRSEIKRSQNRSLDTRSLLVVAVRGSVSWADWGMDLGTQFTNIQLPTFTDGSNAIYQTLYGTGEANDCPECHGASGGCVHCMGYITYHNLINPIILITGHSLGAAIVNITATRLNNDVVRPNNEVLQWDDDQQGAENIFAYAFATPNTVEVSENNHAIHYTNIFNILNNNDIVTFVPKWSTDVLFGSTNWQRNGKDYRVTMPFSVSIPVIRLFDFNRIGLIGHAMSNYLSWLEQLPGKLNKTPEEISKTDLGNLTDDSSAYGLLPKLLKIACPVSVTIEDENGNTLAFESEQANVVYPQISAGSEIVSWITQDSEKVFLIPYGQEDVTAEIHAYDEGVMTLSVGTIGIEGSPDEKTFNDVILYDGKDFETSISVDSPIEDTQLLITENGNTVGEVTETNPLLHSVSTNCVHTNNGIDSIITIVTDKTVSKVQFRNVYDNGTMTFTTDHSAVTLTEDENERTWVIHHIFGYSSLYDIGTKVGYNWYYTQRALYIE